MRSNKHREADKTAVQILHPTQLGARITAPVILITLILLSFAYLADMIYTGGISSNAGENFFLSRLLLESGNLLSKLIYPLLGAGIAAALGGNNAIPAGLFGGMLASTGATFASTNANATGVSGVFGCILAGSFSGICTKIIDNILCRKSRKEVFTPFLITSSLSIILTLVTALLINTVSEYINHFASTMAGVAGNTNGLLLSLILGIFMTADSGGPLYLAGYTFGVASISTGEPRYMAVAIAAGAIPPLTMWLYSIIYKERTQSYERVLGTVGIIGGILGLPHSALCFYTTKTYKFIFACVPGGIVASILSFAFNCSSEMPVGGILGFSSYGRPLFFILALACGAMLSTLILSLTDGFEYGTTTDNNEESVETSNKISLQT